MHKRTKSIITDESYCYIHKMYLGMNIQGTEEHHCLHGNANRKLAEIDGLKVMLCSSCHKLLHDKGYHDKDLQKVAQRTWMQVNSKTQEEFIKRYGKNYL